MKRSPSRGYPGQSLYPAGQSVHPRAVVRGTRKSGPPVSLSQYVCELRRGQSRPPDPGFAHAAPQRARARARGPFKARRVTSAARSGPAPASGAPSAQARRGGSRRGSGRASGGGGTGLRRRLLRPQWPAPWAPEVPGRRDARDERGTRRGLRLGGEPHAGGSPRGGRDSQAPAGPVGVPAPPTWRGPESNRTCPWGSRGGRRGAQPLTGGTVCAAVGVLLHPAWHGRTGRGGVGPRCGGLDLAR